MIIIPLSRRINPRGYWDFIQLSVSLVKKKEEEEGEEVYHDAIGDERRDKVSSGIKENEDAQKKVEKKNDVRSLELSRVMELTVTEENWRREGSGSIKEKIMKKDSVRKLENTKMKNSAESYAERR